MVPVSTTPAGETVPDWEGMATLGQELREKTIQARVPVLRTAPGISTEPPELDFAPMLLTEVFNEIRAAGQWFDLVNGNQEGPARFPYVARNGTSNGVATFVPSQETPPPNPGNVITVGVSTATVFYQPKPFYSGKEIQVLSHSELNLYNGLFLVSTMRKQMSKFQWGNGASLKRLKATRIMVPITPALDGGTIPDWKGMSAYGRAMRARVENAISDSVTSEEGAHV